jgi:hypothetical protein
MSNYRIVILREKKWKAQLIWFINKKDVLVEEVLDNCYSGMIMKMADKGFIDKLNNLENEK